MMEQENLWNRWDHFNFGANQTDPVSGVAFGPNCFMKQKIKTLVCPSNTNAGNPFSVLDGPGNYFINSYFASAGTRGYPRRAAAGIPSLNAYRDGVFDQNRQNRIEDVSDGTSNTLMFGERHYFDPVFNAIPDENIGDWGWCWFGAQGDAFLGANVPINFKLPANFNSLSGAQQQQLYDDRINAYGSGHTGGANFTLSDGSVRFIRDSISPATLLYLGTKSGGEVIPGDF
jgi:hypothetical protein